MNEIEKLKVGVYDLLTISERKQKELMDLQKQINEMNAQIVLLSQATTHNQKETKK